ncbi:MAG: hypothetical protein FWD57_14615, partial [Polyangiaceae bacterium]|nr:hypothetical protein [Polyangiaceae bacterium]
MKRFGCIIGLSTGMLLCANAVDAAPTELLNEELQGDFIAIGNTLAHDCRTRSASEDANPILTGTPPSSCGSNTGATAPDIFWTSMDNDIPPGAVANMTTTATQARTTAFLKV